ncbi:hypothetical protein FA10DRAFT_61072 [Acaromyces ingoldii]|uniref:Uncharacterized protein n=1 Tax=Acaromyces ingoldii TaxID=215250 RepID=A0A316YT20_9BASI|nr:hypothetical protein FA10DRAFT_61072 [Acaromyces ingoldii]PWN91163.1 hypothetical protein FA10DRAFT_61072 [Acaromyces ingoldii]
MSLLSRSPDDSPCATIATLRYENTVYACMHVDEVDDNTAATTSLWHVNEAVKHTCLFLSFLSQSLTSQLPAVAGLSRWRSIPASACSVQCCRRAARRARCACAALDERSTMSTTSLPVSPSLLAQTFLLARRNQPQCLTSLFGSRALAADRVALLIHRPCPSVDHRRRLAH